MEFLSLTSADGGTSPTPLNQPEPKSPGLAFILGLLIPGLGLLYCGQKRRGFLTFLFFALGAGCVVAFWDSAMEGENVFFGLGLRAGLVLYGFSFLDAYFTAQEMSEGRYRLLIYHPRVAAVLNLLTRGFGYWYVDEKKKGFTLFFLVGIAGRAASEAHNAPITNLLSVLVEVALAVMAVDAYRIASRANEKSISAGTASQVSVQPVTGLKPVIPLIFASLLALGYATLVFIGIAMPENKNTDQSQAVITEAESGAAYVNRKYDTELRVPRGWTLTKGDEEAFAKAEYLDGACSVILTREAGLPFVTARLLPGQLLKEIQKQQSSFKLIAVRPSRLGTKPAHDIVYAAKVGDVEVTQTYAYVQNGFWVNFVVITVAEPFKKSCDPDVQNIREQVVLPH